MKRKVLAAILCAALTAGTLPVGAASAGEQNIPPSIPTEDEAAVEADDAMQSIMEEMVQDTSGKEYDAEGVYCDTWSEVPKPSRDSEAWREGMVSGNGENGVITSGSPYSDTLIYQYMYFNFPSADPVEAPKEEYLYLDEARQAVFNLDDSWDVHGRNRTFYYSFHPGAQLSLNMQEQGNVSDYKRWTNYETAEVGVRYTDEKGEWERRTFTSREDNVTITSIQSSSEGEPINMTLTMDDISDMCHSWDNIKSMQYKKIVADDCSYLAEVGKYPSYANSDMKYAGYSTVTYVVVEGGTKEKVQLEDETESFNVGEEQDPAIRIQDADAVYLITKSNRDLDMCSFKNFAAKQQYDLVDTLVRETGAVAEKAAYRNEDGTFSYEKALEPSAKLHGEEFNSAKFTLDGDEADKLLSNEDLLDKQRRNGSTLNHAMVERAWYAGRYAQLCASGICAYRLCGMWTGEFNGGWRYIFTMDANVNLQVSAMNTNNMSYGPLGYITYFLRMADDFETNAHEAYNMHDAIQISVNTDGDHGEAVEYDKYYPFQYWNAGSSWCLLPIYEYWQCYGNQQIPVSDLVDYYKLKSVLSVEDEDMTDEEMTAMLSKGYLDLESEILLPLLTKQANFWEQFVTPEYYMDADGKACYEAGKKALKPGERYMLIPCYSPENNPIGYSSTITANATMDIAAAKDGLDMTIALEKAVKRDGWEKAVEKWQNLKALLPEYKYDYTPGGDGALREWAVDEYQENNNHRHTSHLYVAWPGYETKSDEKIKQGSIQSLINRNRYNQNDATTGHGWMHRALVYARVEDGDGAADCMRRMMAGTTYYNSFMTDHNLDRGSNTYCTDTSMGVVGTINEMVLFSNTGEIQLCPALASDWTSGSMDGLMARTQAEVEKLSWDTAAGRVSAQIRSDIDQSIQLTSKIPWGQAVVTGADAQVQAGESITLNMHAGDVVNVEFYGDAATKESLETAIQSADQVLASHKEGDAGYVASANQEYAAAIAAANAVFADGSADETAIRKALNDLAEARKLYQAAYDDSLSAALADGVYTKPAYFEVNYSGSDKLEVRYTTDGTEPTGDSPVLSDKKALKAGVSNYKAALFVKESKEKIGETITGKYMYLTGKNAAQNKAITSSHDNWGGSMTPSAAVDGSYATRWAVRGDYDTYEAEIDLGAETAINSIYVDEYAETVDSETNRLQSFELYAYIDGKYEPICSYSVGDESSTQLSVLDTTRSSHAKYGAMFNEVTTRKVKISMQASKEISIWELQLFDAKEVQEPEPTKPPVSSSYQVTFDSAGGTAVQAQTVKDGEKAAQPKNPTRRKYIFKGWYAGNVKYNFASAVHSDLTLKAEWSKVQVKTTKVKTTKAKTTKCAVTAKKVKGAAGYQFLYAADKKFKKSVKKINSKTAKATLKKLKKNKTYYVKVRAYKYDSKGKKVYGKYGAGKSFKTKK